MPKPKMSKEEQAFKDAIKAAGAHREGEAWQANKDRVRDCWAQYADWLEEQGRKTDAAHARNEAGVSEVRYCVVKKGEKYNGPVANSFSSLNNARASITHSVSLSKAWRMKPIEKYEDSEIIVYEMVPVEVGRLPARSEDYKK